MKWQAVLGKLIMERKDRRKWNTVAAVAVLIVLHLFVEMKEKWERPDLLEQKKW